MSDIDYIKNVQVLGDLNNGITNNEFTLNTVGYSITNPPDVMKLTQLNAVCSNVNTIMCSLWSDLSNSHIATFICENGVASISLSNTIKLNEPLIGLQTFKVYEFTNSKFEAIATDMVITINLEFIKYKK